MTELEQAAADYREKRRALNAAIDRRNATAQAAADARAALEKAENDCQKAHMRLIDLAAGDVPLVHY